MPIDPEQGNHSWRHEVAVSNWHENGRRAPFESVWRAGIDITDSVAPQEWPDPWRADFLELGWRPWSAPGVEPVWWVWADGQTEPTPGPAALRQAQRVASATRWSRR